jgi:methionyl aminopeptidase
MILIKTDKEIAAMQECGKIARRAIDEAVKSARAGMTTMELNDLAEKVILGSGGLPCFKGYEDFPTATCINVNEGIVHGFPGSYSLKVGDIVSVDLGVRYKGMVTDVSETFELTTNRQQKFLEAGRKALAGAVETCVVGNHIGDISFAIQKTVEALGYTVTRDLAGHGVGREVHEDPYIPCYGRPKRGEKLLEGMTLALEVIYQTGSPDLILEDDGWTLATRDGSLSALFEKTVALTRQGVLVLT